MEANNAITEEVEGSNRRAKAKPPTNMLSYPPSDCNVASSCSERSIADHSNSSSSCSDGGANKQRGPSDHSSPRCQVDGCTADLKNARRYHRRHRVCEIHFKASTVRASSGFEERFCQQCSRFHVVSEFDEGKRSCRAKLAGHNERRRKPQASAALSEDKTGSTDRFPAPAQKLQRIPQTQQGTNIGDLKSSETNCTSSEAAAAAERVLSLLSNNVDEEEEEERRRGGSVDVGVGGGPRHVDSESSCTTRGGSTQMQNQSQLSPPLHCSNKKHLY